MVGVATALSACLLFCLELWAGKVALPRFGGTASVWTTSLMFFQSVLLLGYAYAHLLTTRFSAVRQRQVHAGVAVLALLAAVGAWASPPTDVAQPNPDVLSVVLFLARTIGFPFFLLSATTPLLQVWWAQARPRAFPWKYYALSNAGSLLALTAYPLLLEPRVGLALQAKVGLVAFFACAALVVGLAFALRPRVEMVPLQPEVERASDLDPGASRWTWLGWAGLASVLLGATHNLMCQDVAPTPLLWAVPLAVYLLSFVVTFTQSSWYRREWVLGLLAAGAVWVTYLFFKLPGAPLWSQVVGFSLLQGAASLYCHGELFARRPEVSRLSEFYFWLAGGGALGAAAVSVLAPMVLDDYWEYPAAATAVMVVALVQFVRRTGVPKWQRGALAAAGVVVLSALGVGFIEGRRERAVSLRNFFGVLRVDEWGSSGTDSHRYALRHGSITHGMQFVAPTKRMQPTTYFTQETGLGQALKLMRAKRVEGLRVAVLGLGVGTTAALLEAKDEAVFYDINPQVVALAKGAGGYFSFLKGSAAKTEVRVGDARLLLEQEARSGSKPIDLIVVDVFSGDAIPAHLFTREAFELYEKHLKADGILALHVSNRHLNLERVAFGLAQELNLHAVVYENMRTASSSGSTWVLLSGERESIEPLKETADSTLRRGSKKALVWTDDLHSLWSVFY